MKEPYLVEIVRTENIKALERYSRKKGTYKALIKEAKELNINLDHLEELLWMI